MYVETERPILRDCLMVRPGTTPSDVHEILRYDSAKYHGIRCQFAVFFFILLHWWTCRLTSGEFVRAEGFYLDHQERTQVLLAL